MVENDVACYYIWRVKMHKWDRLQCCSLVSTVEQWRNRTLTTTLRIKQKGCSVCSRGSLIVSVRHMESHKKPVGNAGTNKYWESARKQIHKRYAIESVWVFCLVTTTMSCKHKFLISEAYFDAESLGASLLPNAHKMTKLFYFFKRHSQHEHTIVTCSCC